MPGVYISFPFCGQKCTYCNFASGVFSKELEAQYLDALGGEIRAHQWQWTPETVFIGGGTPSQLAPDSVRVLFSAIPGRPWREATMEAAPGSFGVEQVRAWRDAGINRVSLGVQSFVKKELARTGRKHDAQVVAADVALLRAEGISNFNIDLIAGLPGQTSDSWLESLESVKALDAPHVSVYMLEVDEDSRLGLEILDGGGRYGARDVPSNDAIADMYEFAAILLADAGIPRYEISNFARPGAESIHNLKYWRREPYVGFGSDAHSFDGERRRQNVEMADQYVRRSTAGEPLVSEETAANADEERWFLGLRLTEGVAIPMPQDLEPVSRFLRDGLMEQAGDRVRLTPRGILISNEIFAEFIS
ncbi:MAG: radical SAM family heme chaperone HemW [Bryobacteraceae bacterium]